MPQLSFVTVDVFTRTRFQGNPLAICKVPAGQDVSTEQMQRIAFEFNLSETLFLYEHRSQAPTGSDAPEWRVRIFLTTQELPFAGHPVIGAACYALGELADYSDTGRLVCNAGPIEISYGKGVAKASIPHNVHVHTETEFTVDQVYELQPGLQKAGTKPKSIDLVSPVKGMSFVCVELPDLEALGTVQTSGVKPNPKLDKGWEEGFPASFFYVVTSKDKSGVKLRTRMIEGPLEDAATGSASCAIGAFLAMKWKTSQTVTFELTQGVEMGRQSDIGVVVELNEGMDGVEMVELSGSAVKVMEGQIQYSDWGDKSMQGVLDMAQSIS